jgi:3-oxoadipate enol-lactonase
MGSSMPFDDRGSGLPVVLLHAFPVDRRIWRHQLAGLSDVARVVIPDLRGFGQNKTTGAFTLVDLADDVKSLVDSLGLGKVVLCGLSMGGYVTQALAAKYPTVVRGVILADTKSEADTPDGKAARDKMIALVKEKGSKAVAEQMLPKMLAPDMIKADQPVVAEVRSMMESCPPDTIATASRAMRDRPDRTADMARLKVPALVIVGEHDATISRDVATKLAQTIQNGRLHVVPGAGHLSPIESPDDVTAAIRTFLKELA